MSLVAVHDLLFGLMLATLFAVGYFYSRATWQIDRLQGACEQSDDVLADSSKAQAEVQRKIRLRREALIVGVVCIAIELFVFHLIP